MPPKVLGQVTPIGGNLTGAIFGVDVYSCDDQNDRKGCDTDCDDHGRNTMIIVIVPIAAEPPFSR